ncbi:MAG TPA: TrkA family potassium uptake protein [Acidothermaceae bacterium]|nr:TrkA family potassium uptake protein [Acidothermaceae bacterium]
MKALIAGAGKLGTQSARMLADSGYSVTIIEQDDARVAQMLEAPVGRIVTGDACETSILEEAGAFSVELLVAATGDDEDNLVISLLAKRQFAVPQVVARVNDVDNTWLFDSRWGVDVTIPAAMPLVSLIEEATGSSDTVAILRLTRAGVTVIETALSSQSSSAGCALQDIDLPPDALVATIIRSGKPTAPTPDLILAAGDEVLVVSGEATAGDVRRAFQ